MATYSIPEQNLTYNLPDEGTTFRVTGDNGDAVYKVVDGKVTTLYSPSYIANTSFRDPSTGIVYQAGQISTNPNNVEWLDPAYRGTATSKINAFNVYQRETGTAASTLPEYNMADIQTVLARTGGILPKVTATQTVAPNNANAAVVTSDGQVVSPPAPTPQPGAITPTPQTIANPNVANPTTGAQQSPATSLAPMQPQTNPAVPIGQTAEQRAAAIAATGQQPVPQQPTTPQPQTVTQPSGYTGPSIVDYLKSVGQPSDFASRSVLAAQYGIQNYSGTAEQNTSLLNTLRSQQQPATSTTSTQNTTSSSTTSGGAGSTQDDGTAANQYLNDKYANLDPIARQVAMYTDTYKALGLDTIKQQWEGYQKQHGDLANELNDKINKERTNPWYSQGIADAHVEKLQKAYAVKLDTLVKLQTLAESIYTKGLAQAENIVSGANADYKLMQENAQKQIDAANSLAKDNQIVSIGGRQMLVSKVLINGKPAYQIDLGPISSSEGDFTLTPGARRYDADGNIIASVPPTRTTDSREI